MFNQSDEDLVANRIYLNELKSTFHRLMIEGATFEEVKIIYLKIKELESRINVMQWPATFRLPTSTSYK